jgi:hypothetical protein
MNHTMKYLTRLEHEAAGSDAENMDYHLEFIREAHAYIEKMVDELDVFNDCANAIYQDMVEALDRAGDIARRAEAWAEAMADHSEEAAEFRNA